MVLELPYSFNAYGGIPESVLTARAIDFSSLNKTVVSIFADRIQIKRRTIHFNSREMSQWAAQCCVSKCTGIFLETLRLVPEKLLIEHEGNLVLQIGISRLKECGCANHHRLNGGRATLEGHIFRYLETLPKERLRLAEVGHGNCLQTAFILYECYRQGFKSIELSLLESKPFNGVSVLTEVFRTLTDLDPSFSVSIISYVDFSQFVGEGRLDDLNLVFAADFDPLFTVGGAKFMKDLRHKIGGVPLMISSKGSTQVIQPEHSFLNPSQEIRGCYAYLDETFPAWKAQPITLFIKNTSSNFDILIPFALGCPGIEFKVVVHIDLPLYRKGFEDLISYHLPSSELIIVPKDDTTLFVGAVLAFVEPSKKMKEEHEVSFSESSVNFYFHALKLGIQKQVCVKK